MANLRTMDYMGFEAASSSLGTSGWMFWSGSKTLTGSGTAVGKDTTYTGIGLEAALHSESFFRYSASSAGSGLQIRTDTFFLGSTDSFISGSGDGTIAISSSNFELTNLGTVTMQGSITATAGAIGGATIDGDSLAYSPYWRISASNAATDPVSFISSSGFKVSADGRITGSEVLLGDKGGGNYLQFAGSTLTVQGTITADNIRTPSSIEGAPSTVLNASSSINSDGYARFASGSIGGWDITSTRLVSPNDRLELDVEGGTNQIKIAKTSVAADSADYVRMYYSDVNNFGIQGKDGGSQIFHLGSDNEIAGWTFDNEKLTGGDMIINKDGTIESDGFVSNLPGSGFRLTAASGGFLEVENARIRGTLSTAVFEKESVNAVGGQLYVANSTIITGSTFATLTSGIEEPSGYTSSAYPPTETTISCVNVSGFAEGEIISAKRITTTGFSTEYMKIESSSRFAADENDLTGAIYVERGLGTSYTGVSGSLGDSGSAAQSYTGSQVIVSTGKLGTGYVRINANPNDPYTPYIDIVERIGSDVYDVDLKARLGDLSGITDNDFSDGVTGYGLYTGNGYFKGKIEVGSLPKLPSNENLVLHFPLDGSQVSEDGTKIVTNLAPTGSEMSASYGSTDPAVIGTSPPGPAGVGVHFVNGASITNRRLIVDNSSDNKPLFNHSGSGAAFSVGAWVYLTDAYSGEGRTIASTYNYDSGTDQTGWNLGSTYTGNYLGFTVYDKAGTANYLRARDDDYQTTRIDEWHHVFGTYISGSGATGCIVKLYIDGKLETAVSGALEPDVENFDIHIGQRAAEAQSAWSGYISEFRMYNTALSDEDIQALYLNPKGSAGGTIIDGNRISTGQIRSTDWGTSAGSQIDLDAGTFKLGGSTNSPFSWDGTDLNISGSSVTLEAPTFFMGDSGTQFISGSNNQIEISSSQFHLQTDGSITASAALITGDITVTGGPITASLANLPSDEFLFAYYPLHNSVISAAGFDRVLDYSGNEYHGEDDAGSISGGTLFVSGSTSGPVPGAAYFDGTNSRIDVNAAKAALTANMDLSLSFWINPGTSGGDSANDQDIMPFGFHDVSNNDLIWTFNDGGTNNLTQLHVDGANLGTLQVPTTYEFTNNWRHIVIVIEDGAQAKLYVDGNYIGAYTSANADTANIDDVDEILLGGELDSGGGAPTNDFHGYMAEFRMYNTALTAENANALYNQPAGPVSAGTKISGDMISTGQIQSTNWAAATGSQIDLDAGTIKMGGSSNPAFDVTSTGLVTATNFGRNTVTVLADGTNLANYAKSVAGGVNLVFDGSEGGDICMHMILKKHPGDLIKGFDLPQSATGLDCTVTVDVQVTGVKFDDATIAPDLLAMNEFVAPP